jgi:hypothetical protein
LRLEKPGILGNQGARLQFITAGHGDQPPHKPEQQEVVPPVVDVDDDAFQDRAEKG